MTKRRMLFDRQFFYFENPKLISDFALEKLLVEVRF